jgi:hypothetical protein
VDAGVRSNCQLCYTSRLRFGPGTDEGFDEVARQLKEYLAGGRRAFDLPL